MTFVHRPTLISCAVGVTLTMLDLCLWQHFVLVRALREWDTLRLPSGEKVLDALARHGAVEVCRDKEGQVTRIDWSSAAPQLLLEIGRLQHRGAAV